jgi:hypothetical protein
MKRRRTNDEEESVDEVAGLSEEEEYVYEASISHRTSSYGKHQPSSSQRV